MEDHRLKSFCLVVEMKSFSKAAAAKFMTQSAMSHLIKNLEDELGVKLLNRHGKAVTPTPAGRLFYDHAKKILEQYKTMGDAIYASVNTIKGPLHIGATTIAASCLLPQVFFNFSRKYPEVQIDLSVVNTEKLIKDLHAAGIELGIGEGNIKDSSVSWEEIGEDEIVIIASEDNPLTRKRVLTPQDLVSQPFIMPETGSGTREFIDEFIREIKLDSEHLTTAMTLGNPELIVSMVQSGMGISFVSKWTVFRAIKDGSVRLLTLSGKKRLRRKFYLIRLDKGPTTVVARKFREFIKEYRFFAPF